MPHVHWADFDSHGYTIVDVTPLRVAAEWWAVDDILTRLTGERCVAAWEVRSSDRTPVPSAGLHSAVDADLVPTR